MEKITITLQTEEHAKALCKRMVFLAFNACGGAMGMGVFQEMRLGGKVASEEEVWNCAYNKQDYPGGRSFGRMDENEVDCDYVYGRMMKWGCSWNKNIVTVKDFPFKRDYQGFSGVYRDNLSLIHAALKSLNMNAEIDGVKVKTRLYDKPARRIEVEEE